jgi:uncharacterized membrane protein required for colicin V production
MDLLVLGIIAAFAMKGLKQGLVLSLAGGLAFVAGIYGARVATDYLTPYMGRLLSQVLGEGTAINVMEHIPTFPWASGILTQPTARLFAFTFSFLVITLALYCAAMFLNSVVKLPVLNLANKLGGLAGGALTGGAVVWLGVYVLRYFGIPGPGMIERTVLLSFVYKLMPQIQTQIQSL